MASGFPAVTKEDWSDLQKLRAAYAPVAPPVLKSADVAVVAGSSTAAHPSFPKTSGKPTVTFASASDSAIPQKKEALRVGVASLGAQAPGANTLVAGLFDALRAVNADSKLLAVQDGVLGLVEGTALEITPDVLDLFRNQGGSDLLGGSASESLDASQREATRAAVKNLKLDSLVLLGGAAAATAAAQLAEEFAAEGSATTVVAVPCTINNDLKSQDVEVTVGFDTACRGFSELISNICTDALSAGKYYYFVRVMGGSTSHVALECALQSHSNLVVLGEEVAAANKSLADIANSISDAVAARSEKKSTHHGVIVLPEGLLHHIAGADTEGEAEKLLIGLVEAEMARRTETKAYAGKKFNGIAYFFGQQARGSLPSNFDCNYAYAVGRTAAHLVLAGASGYLATVSNLAAQPESWRPAGVPIATLTAGQSVVSPSPLDLNSKAAKYLEQQAQAWLMDDLYRNPGPLQFEGPGANERPITLALDSSA